MLLLFFRLCFIIVPSHHGGHSHAHNPGRAFRFIIGIFESLVVFIGSLFVAAALIAAVKARSSYANEDWLILITSDHGGVYTGHGPQFAGCRQIFLAANKKVWG